MSTPPWVGNKKIQIQILLVNITKSHMGNLREGIAGSNVLEEIT